MTQITIEALLKQKIGLDANTLGGGTIARAIQQRMANCNLTNIETYLKRLQSSNQELEELIETVVVPETWFFRYGEPFVFLSLYVMSEWLPSHPRSILRVLSVPCSTGEEPYSIAIALIEAGLVTKNFCIDAVDINKKSLLKAKRAVYSRNSFRGEDLAFRERYFTQTLDEYQLCDLVKNSVNFFHGNLLDPYFLKDKNPYDVIFCRNVLIYFDTLAREQSLQVLERLLTNKGLLFVGHSETGLISSSRFVPVQHPFAFAYRKIENKKLDVKDTNKSNVVIQSSDNLQKIRPKLSIINNSNRLVNSSKAVKNQNLLFPQQNNTKLKKQNSSEIQTSNLETARRLADDGQLKEATVTCQTYLNQNPTSAEAYVLLGQLHQAKGHQEQAEQCFQKAIYLEPNHYEALIHLALLKEHQGDIAKAAVLRQRIQRLQTFPEKEI
jgi:chemotaxis protein methyltransferase WspC